MTRARDKEDKRQQQLVQDLFIESIVAALCEYNKDGQVVSGPNLQKIHAMVKKISLEYQDVLDSCERVLMTGRVKTRGTGQHKKYISDVAQWVDTPKDPAQVVNIKVEPVISVKIPKKCLEKKRDIKSYFKGAEPVTTGSSTVTKGTAEERAPLREWMDEVRQRVFNRVLLNTKFIVQS